MSEKPERQRIVEEAIEWMVRLQSGDFSAAEGDALNAGRRCRASMPRCSGNCLAASRRYRTRPGAASRALPCCAPWSSRRAAGASSAAPSGCSSCSPAARPGALGQAGMGLPGELATGTGERRDWLLADGSRLRLNARSKARPLLDGAQRRLELRRGAMRLEVKEDPRGAFALDCAAGRVDCASGSLLLAEERGAIRLVTLRGSARLTTGEDASWRWRHDVVCCSMPAACSNRARCRPERMPGPAAGWRSTTAPGLGRGGLPALSARHPPARRGDRRQPRQRSVPAGRHAHVLDMLGRSLPIRVLRYSDYWISLRPA